jgi:hypothetical protein
MTDDTERKLAVERLAAVGILSSVLCSAFGEDKIVPGVGAGSDKAGERAPGMVLIEG